MLDEEIKHFLTYCKISEFAVNSIEALTTWLNEFKEYLETATIRSAKEISYRHLREYVAEFKTPSIHEIVDIVDYIELLFLRRIIFETAEVETPN